MQRADLAEDLAQVHNRHGAGAYRGAQEGARAHGRQLVCVAWTTTKPFMVDVQSPMVEVQTHMFPSCVTPLHMASATLLGLLATPVNESQSC